MRLGPRGTNLRTPPIDPPNSPGHQPPGGPTPPVVVAPDPVDPDTGTTTGSTTGGTPDPTPTGEWTVNLTFVNQTNSEKAKQNAAATEIQTVMTAETAAFKAEILAHKSYNGSTGYYGSSSTCNSAGELGNIGLSVWNRIWAANETLLNTVDHQMDLTIEMYYENTSTIGYTYSNVNKIWCNRKFHDGYRPDQVAGNFFHEWLHKNGYGHSSASTSCRPYSVPYAVGYMMRERCYKYNDDVGY